MRGKAKSNEIEKLIAISHERLKELAAINQTVSLIKEGKTVDETVQKICNLLPKAWQHSEHCIACIVIDGKTWTSNDDFVITKWIQVQNFSTIDSKKGRIEIYYSQEFPFEEEGPFLKEERNLLNNLANIIAGYLNFEKGKSLITPERRENREKKVPLIPKDPESGLHLLHKFLGVINAERDIYHDLMPFKVKEILLVATLYNAFNLELEGSFSNDVFSEYHHLNLSSIPRITGVSSYEEAENQLNYKHFDLIIIMIGVDKETPFTLCEKIKSQFNYVPVYLLLNYSHEAELIRGYLENRRCFDRVFTWNGNSKVFFAMVKHLEDISNVENDTNVGLVNIILLVEDSAEYYSKYLPVLYDNILLQTKKMIDDVNTGDIYKLFRLRTRPKILLATTYEEAKYYYNKYKDNFLCVISDIELDNNNQPNCKGLEFIEEIRSSDESIPVILNSSEDTYQQKAFDLNALFINKNSETLLQDINSFVNHHLGFGKFIYKTSKGIKITTASSLKEFERILHTIPDDSLIYHGKKCHYSLWLRARGEIEIARQLHGIDINSFQTADELRKFLIGIISQNIRKKERGRIVAFDREALCDNSNIVSLAGGLLGGKGRGLAFINTLLNNLDFANLIKDINITLPRTTVIGSDEFDSFLQKNNIKYHLLNELDDISIKKRFIHGKLSNKLIKRLEILVNEIEKPLAFRSSGLMEDSISQPFAGIFETYLLPNNQKDIKERLQQASNAVKLVFASVFTKVARSYLKAVSSNVEEERMAVIVQEVVGNEYHGYFYPHISGVAQSYNYYPVSHMKPEDGFAIQAVGLGKYVVEGEKTFRFSPNFPEIEITSLKDQLKNSQTQFYAVDMNKSNIDLLEGEDAGLARLDISIAEKHNTLRHLASVYDIDSESILPGLSASGPRVINFANILKYKYIPLAETIGTVLRIAQEALGCPSEIEFAVDLKKDENNKATFYLLQIKPLVGTVHDYKVNIDEIDSENTLLYAEKGMGNGLIEDINNVIYISPDCFDKKYTKEMADEIEHLNDIMVQQNKKYVLIGPGRWGTRDKWIGIPVNWPQISNAIVIIEYSLRDFPLDASLGSHFFHNVTANNIGYFSILQESKSFIKWDLLAQQKEIKCTKYFRHVQFDNSFSIKIDGKERIAVITTNN